jgi:CBS domain-containing protein
VVEDPEGKKVLVGFTSERDCLHRMVTDAYFGAPVPPHTAATTMRILPVCVQADRDLFALASILVQHGYRHLPVVEEGRLLGIVSRRDVLKAIDNDLRAEHRDGRRRHRPALGRLLHRRFIVSGR